MKFHLFTVANSEENMWRLFKTTKKHNLELNTVNNNNCSEYTNKITTFLDAIKELPDDDIICFVDANDVICFADEKEILDKFYSYDCKVLLSSETNCYPEQNKMEYDNYYRKLKETNTMKPYTNYLYVNSGGYMGYKRNIQQLLEWKSEEEINEICKLGSEQHYFTLYFLKYSLLDGFNIKLDWRQLIFQNVYRVRFQELSMVNGRLFNDVLGTFPCFIHFNGLNLYNYKMINENNGNVENIMNEMIYNMDEKKVKLNYRLLYYTIYNNVEVKEIEQMNLTISRRYETIV
jgi:hypothetical protein